ncbi:unnamed protein product, partial [Discosporangium mesarthrocarpum]
WEVENKGQYTDEEVTLVFTELGKHDIVLTASKGDCEDESHRSVLVRAETSTGLSSNHENLMVHVYGRQIYFEVQSPGVQMQVLNINGQVLADFESLSDQGVFNIPTTIQSGIYILKMVDTQGTTSRTKFFLED